MSALVCVECGVQVATFERGWRAFLTDHTYHPAFAVIYCPACAERAFGPPETRAREDETD